MSIKGPIAVLGAGVMGTSISHSIALAGFGVIVYDVSREQLKQCRQSISSTLQNITTTTSLADLSGCSLIIETIDEDLFTKQKLLQEVRAMVGANSIITSNTSTLSLTKLGCATGIPRQFAGFHFPNVALTKDLVEIVVTIESDPDMISALQLFARKIGKNPVVVKDRPGYLLNRLLLPYLNDAIQEFDNGLVSSQDLDSAIELGLGYPVGPLSLLDQIGLDTHLEVTQSIHAQLATSDFFPPPLLQRMVEVGHIGLKAGAGFRVKREEKS